jgi:hypothetical protein
LRRHHSAAQAKALPLRNAKPPERSSGIAPASLLFARPLHSFEISTMNQGTGWTVHYGSGHAHRRSLILPDMPQQKKRSKNRWNFTCSEHQDDAL